MGPPARPSAKPRPVLSGSRKRAAMQELAARRALITGGANGIGRAIGFELARRGAAIALIDVDGPAAEATAAELRATGCAVAVADVSQAASVAAAVSAFARSGQPIDI